MADARDFLFNSDYAQDQIVFFKELSLKNIASNNYSESFAHELDFTPLIFGVWDNSPDFDNPKPINSLGKDLYTDNLGEFDHSNQILIYSNPTSCTVLAKSKYQNGSWVSTNFYIRLYAFEPPKSNKTAKPTANHASKFIFNTKYNYLKLKEQGTIEADSGLVSIPHGLGYVPQTLAWGEQSNSGTLFYIDSFFGNLGSDGLVKATTSSVFFNRIGNSPTRYYYRIYYDEA